MALKDKLIDIKNRFDIISKDLMDSNLSSTEIIKLNKEYSRLNEIMPIVNEYFSTEQAIIDAEEMLNEPEMKAFATEELHKAKNKLPELEQDLKILLLPKDEADDRSAIVEIRAGVGGDEAGLFAGDLFRQYSSYAERKGWKIEILDINPISLNGYKEIVFRVIGDGVYERLKFKSGIHRVQRVPETEASGRIHTSAVSVAIMPEAEDVDVNIEEKDLRIDIFRASGAGGQHVNKTDSAVRITHLPTGIVVQSQDERSQIRNKETAMAVLRAKLYEKERQELASKRDQSRKQIVGSGDRSEKIRTYNFPESRVTDHRIKLTLYKLDDILAGGVGLDQMIDALNTAYQLELLSASNEEL